MEENEKSIIKQEEEQSSYQDEASGETTYDIYLITIGRRFAPETTNLVLKDGEKFTIPPTYRLGQGRIFSDQQYLFYPGKTYAINEGRVYEYSDQSVKIYDFQDNPRWTDRDNNPFQNPSLTAFSVQTWNPQLTVLHSESWGYADAYGRTVIPPLYDDATNPSCSNIGAVKQHDKWHFIYVLTGERIDNREYDDVALCSENGYFSYSAKELGEGRGLIDPLGHIATPPIYGTMPQPLHDGTFSTFMPSNPEEVLRIDRHGNVLSHCEDTPTDTPIEASEAATLQYIDDTPNLYESETPCIIVNNEEGKYGLVAYSGRKITDLEYDYIDYYKSSSEGKPSSFFIMRRGDKWGGIDLSGKEILPPIYDSFLYGDSNYIRIEKDKKFGYADIRGTITVPPVYERLVNGEVGVAAGLTGGKWQIIGTDGRTITPPNYDTCTCLGNGFFLVTIEGEHFTLDRNGRRLPFVIDCLKEETFADSEYMLWGKAFQRDFIPAYRLGHKGIIRRDGTLVIPCIYDDLRPLCPGCGDRIIATRNGLSGVIGLSRAVIIPFEYDRIAQMPPHTETIVVCKAGKWGELHPDGNIAFPMEYAGSRDILSTLPYYLTPFKI